MFCNELDYKYLQMLVVDILPPVRLKHVILGPILESEALINSNYCVIENIFLRQLYLDYNKDFNN